MCLAVVFAVILPLYFSIISCLGRWMYVCVPLSVCVWVCKRVQFFFLSFHSSRLAKKRRNHECVSACSQKMDETVRCLFLFQFFFRSLQIPTFFFHIVLSCLGIVLEWESFIWAQCRPLVISWSSILEREVCVWPSHQFSFLQHSFSPFFLFFYWELVKLFVFVGAWE